MLNVRLLLSNLYDIHSHYSSEQFLHNNENGLPAIPLLSQHSCTIPTAIFPFSTLNPTYLFNFSSDSALATFLLLLPLLRISCCSELKGFTFGNPYLAVWHVGKYMDSLGLESCFFFFLSFIRPFDFGQVT